MDRANGIVSIELFLIYRERVNIVVLTEDIYPVILRKSTSLTINRVDSDFRFEQWVFGMNLSIIILLQA